MTLIVDAAAVVAMADRRDPRGAAVERTLRDEEGELVMPAQVSAEADYLLWRRGGALARRAFLEDLAAGRYRVECLRPAEYVTVAELERRYGDLAPGLADLSIVVLAHRFRTTRIATFDERHFRAIQPLAGRSFTLLPADE